MIRKWLIFFFIASRICSNAQEQIGSSDPSIRFIDSRYYQKNTWIDSFYRVSNPQFYIFHATNYTPWALIVVEYDVFLNDYGFGYEEYFKFFKPCNKHGFFFENYKKTAVTNIQKTQKIIGKLRFCNYYNCAGSLKVLADDTLDSILFNQYGSLDKMKSSKGFISFKGCLTLQVGLRGNNKNRKDDEVNIEVNNIPLSAIKDIIDCEKLWKEMSKTFANDFVATNSSSEFKNKDVFDESGLREYFAYPYFKKQK